MFSEIIDFPLTPENLYQIMRTGRACWRIENEVCNTLKNQRYNLEHNFGLEMQEGKKLWQIIRSYFDLFVMPSVEVLLLQSIVTGVRIVFC